MNLSEHEAAQAEFLKSLNPERLFRQAGQILEIPNNELFTRTAADYLNSMQYGWMFRVLFYIGPELDDRLANIVGNTLVYSKIHKPDQVVDIVRSGETTSWNYSYREQFKIKWKNLRNNLLLALALSKDKESLDKKLDVIVANIENEFLEEVQKYAEYIGIPIDRIFMAGSGAQAILLARALLKPNAQSKTTQENGSELFGMMKNQDEAIALRYDDPETGKTNIPRKHADVAADYILGIESGDRFISFTLCSKTGQRYDLKSENETQTALDLVLAYVTRHNEANPEDTVEVVLDAVQLAGRETLEFIMSFLEKEQVCGVVHTASKYARAVSHAGTLVLNDRGKQIYDANQVEIDSDLVKKYQMVLAGDARLPEFDLLTTLRATDNIQAILYADTLRKHEKYVEVVSDLRHRYTAMFDAAGFTVLPNQTQTIIALEAPYIENALSEDIDQYFLALLAEPGKDTAFGGFLKHGKQPILRFGIPLLLVEQVIFDTISSEQLDNSFEDLFQILLAAKEETATLVLS